MGNIKRGQTGNGNTGSFAPVRRGEPDATIGNEAVADKYRRLERLRQEFADAGGRGVHLAEEIDELEADLAIVWADEDGDFLMTDGSYGNPGCDVCGEEDAVVRDGGRYLCELHAGDAGLVASGHGEDPAYPNGRCGACGFGLTESGHCTNSDCGEAVDVIGAELVDRYDQWIAEQRAIVEQEDAGERVDWIGWEERGTELLIELAEHTRSRLQ